MVTTWPYFFASYKFYKQIPPRPPPVPPPSLAALPDPGVAEKPPQQPPHPVGRAPLEGCWIVEHRGVVPRNDPSVVVPQKGIPWDPSEWWRAASRADV